VTASVPRDLITFPSYTTRRRFAWWGFDLGDLGSGVSLGNLGSGEVFPGDHDRGYRDSLLETA